MILELSGAGVAKYVFNSSTNVFLGSFGIVGLRVVNV